MMGIRNGRRQHCVTSKICEFGGLRFDVYKDPNTVDDNEMTMMDVSYYKKGR